MDPNIVAAIVEIAKLGIQSAFTMLRIAGKTDVEIEQFFQEQKDYFDAHPPDTLPDV